MIKDLVEGDGAKKQVVEQDSLLYVKNLELFLKDSVVVALKQKDENCIATQKNHDKMKEEFTATIDLQTKELKALKRKRNGWRALAGILVLSLILK